MKYTTAVEVLRGKGTIKVDRQSRRTSQCKLNSESFMWSDTEENLSVEVELSDIAPDVSLMTQITRLILNLMRRWFFTYESNGSVGDAILYMT